jgi:hypothetical protein
MSTHDELMQLRIQRMRELGERPMARYQLIYNGNPAHPLCDTRDEAEGFKQKAAAQWPEITVEIKQIEEYGK